MMSTNNVLSPANGAPIIVPSQDMILGLYYISMEREGMKGEGMVFAMSMKFSMRWTQAKCICTPRSLRGFRRSTKKATKCLTRFETTPGRMRLGALLPLNAKAPFDLVNRLLRKKEVQQVIDTVYRYCGQKESVIFCDQIMTMGFREAFKAGISFGKDDMVIPDSKWTIVDGRPRAGQGFRTAVHGRPDHAGRKVQQGCRCLVEMLGSRCRRDDGEISPAQR